MEEKADLPLTVASQIPKGSQLSWCALYLYLAPSCVLRSRFLFLKSLEGEAVVLKVTNHSVLLGDFKRKRGKGSLGIKGLKH